MIKVYILGSMDISGQGYFMIRQGLFWDHIVSLTSSEDFRAQKVTRSEDCKALKCFNHNGRF